MPTVTIHPPGKQISIETGQTLLDAFKQLAVAETTAVEIPCGGLGLCGHCRILIVEGRAQPPTDAESQVLSAADLQDGYRLACQVVPLDSLVVKIPVESMSSSPDLQVDGVQITVRPEPEVKRYALHLTDSNLADARSCWQQIQQQLISEHHIQTPRIDVELIRRRDPTAREGSVCVSVANEEVINLYADSRPHPLTGLAVDFGTTKVAGFLVDLLSGSVLASEGILNPQVRHGADVVTRLAYAAGGPQQAREMSQAARGCVNHLAGILANRSGIEPADIDQAVIAGNTVMQHLLLDWPVEQLGRSPYLPASTAAVKVKARELGLNFSPGALVYVMPSVAGYVGGDHTAMILAGRLHRTDTVSLGIDIGTNTELVLSCAGKRYCCSCASGPAFEGAAIRCGVRAVEGAVHQVRVDAGGQVSCRTIADKPAVGVCGSGAVDAMAELVKHGILNSLGTLNRKHPGVRPGSDGSGLEFVLVPAEQSGSGRDITLTQADISTLQLAKAAIAAGTDLLLAAGKVDKKDIEQVMVAGAFGTRLDLESAVTVGIFPDLPRKRFSQLGNAAGTGARLVLLSAAERREAEEIAAKTIYVELAAHPEFGKHFSRAIPFPEPEAETEFP